MKKKQVPQIWYNEVVNDMARRVMECKTRVRMQQKRIDAVIESGLGYETFNNMQIPLAKLYEYLQSAKEDELNLPKYEKERIEFKKNHSPVKELKGNLIAAKLEAKVKKLKGLKTDYNYKLLSRLQDKYLLSNSEGTKLMQYFYKIGIEF